MNCQGQHRDQILLYVADALDEEQHRQLEEHLKTGCPACAACLAEADATLASLATAKPSQEPSSAVRERLMSRVRRMRGKRDRPAAGGTAPAAEPEPMFDAGGDRRRRMDFLWPMLAVAAVTTVTTASLLYVPLRAERERVAVLEQQLRDAGETVTEHEGRLAGVTGMLAEAESLVESLQTSALQMISLQGEEAYANVVARVLWDADQHVCHFFVRSLQPPAAGETYYLWLITEDDRMIPAGQFEPTAENGTYFTFGLPEAASGFTRVGVSLADAEDRNARLATLVLEGSVGR